MAGFVVDTFLVYQFLRRLVQPFTSWPAFELGIIDSEGNILKKKRDRSTPAERNAFRLFDLMILRIKRLLGKFPSGKSRIASFAAALFLIREGHNYLTSNNGKILSEAVESDENRAIEDAFLTFYEDNRDEINCLFVSSVLREDPTPTNTAGGGSIAGIGVGPAGEPPGKLAKGRRRKRKKKRKPRDFITFKEFLALEKKGLEDGT